RNDGRLAAMHIARYPHRLQLGFAVDVHQLERRDAAILRGRLIHGWKFELRVSRPPERRQNPARAGRIFPARESAPASHILKVYFFIAEQRGPEKRGVVIGATNVLWVEKIETAFLSGGDEILFAFPREDGRGVVRVEVAMPEPRPVGGREVIVDVITAIAL